MFFPNALIYSYPYQGFFSHLPHKCSFSFTLIAGEGLQRDQVKGGVTDGPVERGMRNMGNDGVTEEIITRFF